MILVPTPVEPVNLPSFQERGLELFVKRDDLIHPLIIGNKLRKSLPRLQQCQQQGQTSVLTFGGRHSNHLLAIAQAGHASGLNTTGIVRGTDTRGPSAVLDACQRLRMQIITVETDAYYPLQQLSNIELASLLRLDPVPCVIPEGGTSAVAIEGVGRIIAEINDIASYTGIVCAAGTGGTAAGLAWALSQRPETPLPGVLALAVVAGYAHLPEPGYNALRQMAGTREATRILDRHLQFDGSTPFGRYGRPSDKVMNRLRELQEAVSFPLDYVYTGKALLHLEQLALQGRFVRGSRLLFLHTGGYQTAPISAESVGLSR